MLLGLYDYTQIHTGPRVLYIILLHAQGHIETIESYDPALLCQACMRLIALRHLQSSAVNYSRMFICDTLHDT